jgi:hypothetical protein
MSANKFIVCATSKNELAVIVARAISKRFSLIVDKQDSTNWRGYHLCIDPTDRTDEDLEYIRGYAYGVLDTVQKICGGKE